MQAQAYEGYIENGRFYPVGKITQMDGRKRAVVTIFEESAHASSKDIDSFYIELEHLTAGIKEDDKTLRAEWLKRLSTAINLSLDEELPDMQRSAFARSPLGLTD